jgi:hypothetical protein
MNLPLVWLEERSEIPREDPDVLTREDYEKFINGLSDEELEAFIAKYGDAAGGGGEAKSSDSSGENADLNSERKKNRAELLEKALKIDEGWLKANLNISKVKGYNWFVERASEEALRELIEWYEGSFSEGRAMVEELADNNEQSQEGATGGGAGVGRNPNGGHADPEAQVAEGGVDGGAESPLIGALEENIRLREELLGRGKRNDLAEQSAKRRGVFGKKHGGEQERLYNEAREAYSEEVVGLMKDQMDLFFEKNPEATEAEINAEFIKIWSAENQKLIEATKDRIDNGNAMRKIGKFFDKAPTWLKIGIGVGLGVALGAATGGLGLGVVPGLVAATGISAGKAALLTRSGSRRSAINQNANWLGQSAEAGAGDAGSAGIEHELAMRGVESLPKDQQVTHEIMMKWMADKHTESILRDKYNNRKRTAIAVGSAVALTVAAHFISGAIATNRAGGTPENPLPGDGGGTPELPPATPAPPPETAPPVELPYGPPEIPVTIDPIIPPDVIVPPSFNLDYVPPPGSNIGTAFREIFGIQPGSEAYNQALTVFRDATGAVPGRTHVFANMPISESFNGTGAQALQNIADAINNGSINP